MLVQKTHSAECFVATVTRILFGLQVSLKVSPQVGLVGETSRTIVARERFFTGVSAHVTLEQPRSGEALAADVALARQRVCASVHLQGGQRRVALVAELAGETLLDLIGAMQFLMLDESGLS